MGSHESIITYMTDVIIRHIYHNERLEDWQRSWLVGDDESIIEIYRTMIKLNNVSPKYIISSIQHGNIADLIEKFNGNKIVMNCGVLNDELKERVSICERNYAYLNRVLISF